MKKRIALLLLGFSLVVGSCAMPNQASSSSSPIKNTSSPTELANLLTVKINKQYSNANVLVTPYAKNMLLTGQVERLEDRYQIGMMLKNYPSIARVFNYIQVTLPLSSTEIKQDQAINMMALSKLSNNLKAKNIKIVTTNKIVYILGDFTPIEESAVKQSLTGLSSTKNVIVLNNKESQ